MGSATRFARSGDVRQASRRQACLREGVGNGEERCLRLYREVPSDCAVSLVRPCSGVVPVRQQRLRADRLLGGFRRGIPFRQHGIHPCQCRRAACGGLLRPPSRRAAPKSSLRAALRSCCLGRQRGGAARLHGRRRRCRPSAGGSPLCSFRGGWCVHRASVHPNRRLVRSADRASGRLQPGMVPLAVRRAVLHRGGHGALASRPVGQHAFPCAVLLRVPAAGGVAVLHGAGREALQRAGVQRRRAGHTGRVLEVRGGHPGPVLRHVAYGGGDPGWRR